MYVWVLLVYLIIGLMLACRYLYLIRVAVSVDTHDENIQSLQQKVRHEINYLTSRSRQWRVLFVLFYALFWFPVMVYQKWMAFIQQQQ